MHESTEKKQVGNKDRTQITQITQIFVLYKATARKPEKNLRNLCNLRSIPYFLRFTVYPATAKVSLCRKP